METSTVVRVSGLKPGVTPLHIETRPETLEIHSYGGCEVSLRDRVIADLSLLRNHDQVYVSGNVRFRLRLVCADCAREFDQEFNERVSSDFLHSTMHRGGTRVHELGEEELERSFYEGDEIDLVPMLRDTVLLAVPLAPVCRPDCRGICPECGADLNQGDCGCSRSEVGADSAVPARNSSRN